MLHKLIIIFNICLISFVMSSFATANNGYDDAEQIRRAAEKLDAMDSSYKKKAKEKADREEYSPSGGVSGMLFLGMIVVIVLALKINSEKKEEEEEINQKFEQNCDVFIKKLKKNNIGVLQGCSCAIGVSLNSLFTISRSHGEKEIKREDIENIQLYETGSSDTKKIAIQFFLRNEKNIPFDEVDQEKSKLNHVLNLFKFNSVEKKTLFKIKRLLLDSQKEKVDENDKKCPYCAETIKKEAILCRYCGHDLPCEETTITNSSASSQIKVLCSNGSCFGIIGDDGRCEDCGKTLGEILSEKEHLSKVKNHSPTQIKRKALWCDSCSIGVIGSDGRCGDCGKTLDETLSEEEHLNKAENDTNTELSIEESKPKKNDSQGWKTRGVEKIKSGEYKEGIYSFHKSIASYGKKKWFSFTAKKNITTASSTGESESKPNSDQRSDRTTKKSKEQLYVKMGMGYCKSDSYKEAIICFSNAIEQNKNNDEAYFYRAQAYYELRDIRRQKEDLKASAKLGNAVAAEYLKEHFSNS